LSTRVLLVTCALIALASTSIAAATASYDQSPFGVNYLKWHYFDHPGGLDELRTKMKIMKDAGIYWDRDGFDYGDVHPKPEVWKWDFFDKCVALAKEEHINLVGLLLGGPQPDTATRRKDYGEYVYQVVNRYKDSVKIWEIWNEPNIPSFWKDPDAKVYTELIKEAYTRAKQADPTCTIIVGSTSGPGTDWFNGIHANGGWDYCDGISIHPYAMASGPIEQGLDKTLRLLRKQFASFGKPKPIWTTEVGWQATKPNEEEGQATRIVQTYIIHIANGIQNMAYFCMDDYDGWGFVKRDKPLETKQAYGAIQLMTSALGHVPQFEGYLNMPDGVACYVFKKKSADRVLMLWSNDIWNRTLQLDQKNGLTAKDIVGRPIEIKDGKLTVGPTPVIVTGADARKIGKVSMDFNPYLTKPRENLIINPSMVAGRGDPHGWTPGRFFSTDNKGTFATTKEGRNGSTCVSISKSTAPAAWDASPLPVDPDKTYMLTAWIKTKDATGQNAVAMYFYNGNQWGVVGTPTTQSIAGTQDWTMVTVTGKPPKDAALVRVNLISENNTGTTWFDDVTLTEQ
jgi:hypothetical protein